MDPKKAEDLAKEALELGKPLHKEKKVADCREGRKKKRAELKAQKMEKRVAGWEEKYGVEGEGGGVMRVVVGMTRGAAVEREGERKVEGFDGEEKKGEGEGEGEKKGEK